MKNKKLEDITKEEYESALMESITITRQNLRISEDEYLCLVEKLNLYVKDKNDFKITYHKGSDGTIIYKKYVRDKMGFKLNE